MKTIYVAGPMTGIEELNYPAFNEAAELLEAAGYDTLNPVLSASRSDAPHDYVDETTTWQMYMRNALNQVIRAEGIALLPGWEQSRGARLEVYIAEQLGMKTATVDKWLHAASEPTA